VIPWEYSLQNGLGAAEFTRKTVSLKPGEAPPERFNIGPRGYLLKDVGIVEGVGQAVYKCIMEVLN
jgi:hypothetical protein